MPQRYGTYGVTVSVSTSWVFPGVTFEVMLAIDLYVPACLLEASYTIDALPPAVGGLVSRNHSLPFGGAGVRFLPLVPVRFSAPQFWPEAGSPLPALPRPGPSPGKVRFGP